MGATLPVRHWSSLRDPELAWPALFSEYLSYYFAEVMPRSLLPLMAEVATSFIIPGLSAGLVYFVESPGRASRKAFTDS